MTEQQTEQQRTAQAVEHSAPGSAHAEFLRRTGAQVISRDELLASRSAPAPAIISPESSDPNEKTAGLAERPAPEASIVSDAVVDKNAPLDEPIPRESIRSSEAPLRIPDAG